MKKILKYYFKTIISNVAENKIYINPFDSNKIDILQPKRM